MGNKDDKYYMSQALEYIKMRSSVMKHNNKLMPVLLGGALLTSLVVLTPNNSKRVEAYDKTSLTTTICLNDFAEADIRSYYSNLNSLGDTERTGENLLKNLKPILSNGQKYYSYDVSNGTDIWKMYEITDRDWTKSPKEEIEGYDASTNTITGYKYGSSKSNKGSNPYIHALYINRNVENKVHAWAREDGTTSHGNNAEWAIDREHIWPKSHGFEENEDKKGTSEYDECTSGARGDPMHLWAGDSYVNSALHSNYYYGYVDKTKDYTDGKDKYVQVSGNLMGKSKTLGGDTSVFEPQDSDKGDIARAVFYMVARYNNIAGTDAAIENDNPNLELTNDLGEWRLNGYISTSSSTGKLGILSDLLEWNKLDPVDGYELHRNNLLYGNFTNNRNPFIDFPEWADLIWGSEKGNKFANPATDKIAEPKDFVGTFEGDTKKNDDSIIPGIPNTVFFIACAVVGVIVLIVIIIILLKGNKKQKKAVKKIGKKLMKSPSKSKKRK